MLQLQLKKMTTKVDSERLVHYSFFDESEQIDLNPLIGKSLKIKFTGHISCSECKKKIRKSYSQGYCFPCAQKLPQTDLCQMKPEICHFHQNTCRDPDWAQKFCFIDHTIYIALSSGIKVGITRSYQQEHRWMDQGAIKALPIARTKTRRDSGLLEVALKKTVSDKTNWRIMLKGIIPDQDLFEHRARLWDLFPKDLDYEKLEDEKERLYNFPVHKYPTKITSLNLDKQAEVEGTLMGIKGQYLIFDCGVLNVRKFSGYETEWHI